MAEFAMLADRQRSVYPEEVTRQLHVMAQGSLGREDSPVIDRRSDQLRYADEAMMIAPFSMVNLTTKLDGFARAVASNYDGVVFKLAVFYLRNCEM